MNSKSISEAVVVDLVNVLTRFAVRNQQVLFYKAINRPLTNRLRLWTVLNSRRK